MDLLGLLIFLWILPIFVAGIRGVERNTMIAIALVTILSGWTGVGWLVALIWAIITKELKSKTSSGTPSRPDIH